MGGHYEDQYDRRYAEWQAAKRAERGEVNLDILKRTIALKLWPDMASKDVCYQNTVELIVRVVLEMKKDGTI